MDLVRQSGAELAGMGFLIEKAFQPGGDRLRAEGLRVESLARVKSMNEEPAWSLWTDQDAGD